MSAGGPSFGEALGVLVVDVTGATGPLFSARKQALNTIGNNPQPASQSGIRDIRLNKFLLNWIPAMTKVHRASTLYPSGNDVIVELNIAQSTPTANR